MTKKKDKNFSFQKYLIKIIDIFNQKGVKLSFSGRNDLILEGKKVSGSAFIQNNNGMVMHGTLLYDCDINTMVRCITPNNEKLVSKGIKSVFSRVVNLKKYLKNISQDEMIDYLEKKMSKKEYFLSYEEIALIEKNSKKYSSKEWLYFQHPPYSKVLKKRFDWGNIEILLDLNNGEIKKMSLIGDFFNKEDNLYFFTEKFKNIKYDDESLKKVLSKVDIGDYILNANNEDFFSLIKEGILYF
ncbi:lipoate--protein ligase [Candidatus Phytoplasma palmae]|uniref:lipoate--protein ligase n=1 Tax=Candidatus Phytoplasma palmae TaxID=85624 RepID=UPI0039904874